MFGRGEKYVLPVMDLYPKDVIREVTEALNGKRWCYITRVPFETLLTISIDKLTLRKDPAKGDVMIWVRHNVGAEYMKSWKKGLGRFILKDFKKNTNQKSYAFVKYTSDDKTKKIAFIRFISKEEIPDNDLGDMKAYGAISGELTSWVEVADPYDEQGKKLKGTGDVPTYSIEDENFFVVLRVVPYTQSMTPEDILSISYPIKKDTSDNVWITEPDPYEEAPRAKASKVEEEPDEELMNPPEDTLF